jgi:hypothetical protein
MRSCHNCQTSEPSLNRRFPHTCTTDIRFSSPTTLEQTINKKQVCCAMLAAQQAPAMHRQQKT